MTQQTCSKCAVATNEFGDLHCRILFVYEIKQLIAMNELPKARDIFTSAIFDIGWKERLLNKLGGEFRNLVKAHVRLEDERSEREAEMQLRIPHCYKCKKPLNNLSTSRCSICRWINCYECNACGCEYLGEVKLPINI